MEYEDISEVLSSAKVIDGDSKYAIVQGVKALLEKLEGQGGVGSWIYTFWLPFNFLKEFLSCNYYFSKNICKN